VSAVCPCCLRDQTQGLLCHGCTSTLERELADVPAIVAELDVSLSRQARIGNAGRGGLASEKDPWKQRVSIAAGALENVLTTWARDLSDEEWRPGIGAHPAHAAASYLLMSIDSIRKHPAADALHDEVTDAVRQARRDVDRPADRQYLGVCRHEFEGVPCPEELWAQPWAEIVRCKTCGHDHDVSERRAWLLEQAEDMIVTVKEASRYMGQVGGITVTESSIRGYIHRGKLSYRPGTIHGIRLGDLLTVILNEGEKREAS
jgi:hypothetical protein